MMKTVPYLITLAAGFIIALLIFKSCQKNIIAPPVITTPAAIVQNVVKAEKLSYNKIDSFLRIEFSLRKSAQSLKYSYAELQQKNTLLSIHADSLSRLIPITNDYEQGNKDELVNTISMLIETGVTKDSIHASQVNILESIVEVNKVIITTKDSLYSSLRSSFDTAISNNIKLIDFSKVQKKEIRKGKINTTVWKVATIVAGAVILKQAL